MEELLLCALLAGDELHVVEQQQVDHAVFVAEGLHIAFLDGGDQLVGEVLALDIDDAELGMRAAQHVCDRIHQVGLAQAGVAIDKQRVVFRRRALGYRERGRVRKFVRRADDEPLEGIVVIRRSAGG